MRTRARALHSLLISLATRVSRLSVRRSAVADKKRRPHSSPSLRPANQPAVRRRRTPPARDELVTLLDQLSRCVQAKCEEMKRDAAALVERFADFQGKAHTFVSEMIRAMERCAKLTDSPEARAAMETIIAQSRAALASAGLSREEARRG